MENRNTKKKNKTREALLQAAKGLYTEHGLYNVRIEDITSRADVGKGTFYLHFASNEACIAAVLHEGFELLLRALDEIHSDAEISLSIRGGAIIRTHLRFFKTNPEYLFLFHQARGLLKLTKDEQNPILVEFERYICTIKKLLTTSSALVADQEQLGESLTRFITGAISGSLSYDTILDMKHGGTGYGNQYEEFLHRLLSCYDQVSTAESECKKTCGKGIQISVQEIDIQI